MTEIPSKGTWAKVTFGDVVRQVKEKVDPIESGLKRYIAGEHMDSDDLKIRRWGLIGKGYLGPAFHMRFKPGQVLYGSRRTYLRKVALADFEGITANTTYVIESKNPYVLLHELLPYIMQTESFHQHSIKESKGSVNPYVNFSDLAWYEFALPPMGEQQRITQLLTSIERRMEAAVDIKKSLNHVLHAVAREEFSKDFQTNHSPLNKLVRDLAYGPRFSSNLYDKTGELAQIRTTDITDEGEIVYDTIPLVNLYPKDYTNHLLCDGDLVMSRSGSCGITAVFREHIKPTIAAAFLFRISVKPYIDSEYLHEFFSSTIGRQLTTSLARGGVQKNIRGSQLLEQNVPFPSRERQRDVVNRLATIRDGISNNVSLLIDLHSLKKTFLQQIFEV